MFNYVVEHFLLWYRLVQRKKCMECFIVNFQTCLSPLLTSGRGGEFEEVNKAVAVSPIDINPKEDLIQSEQDDFSAPAKFETDEKTENEFSSFQGECC